MGNCIVRKKFVWIVIGLIGLLFLGCKPGGRPEFALPKIKMITGENLHSVVAFTPKEVAVFGNHGLIYHTSEGGTNKEDWEIQESGLKDLLLCEATFIDRDKGWAVGTRGTIIHTTDGGKEWVKQESGTEKNLFSVCFADARNGWVVGEYGTILYTVDGGESWEFQSKDIDKMLNGVFFVDARNGWVVGEFGIILHTTNGGEKWEEQRCKDIETIDDMLSLDWKPMPALYEVYFEDKDKGWIVGLDGVILKTEDRGKVWRKLETNCDAALYGIEIKGKKGWVVGNRGYYLLSLDGGESWVVQDEVIKTRFWLRDVDFSDENNGWIVGARGTIAHSTDGGINWELVSGLTYEMEEYGLADF